MSTDQTPSPASPEPRRERPSRPQAVLEVISKHRVTPSMLRVVLGGPGFTDLQANDSTDKYVKLLLTEPGSDLAPPYDLETLRAESPELLPTKRTYTVRTWDEAAQQIALDFVLHGQIGVDGIAATWADAVQPGDRVAMHGAGGGYAPDPEAGFHLLIGDQSALPAISTALEAMEADARGIALIQLDHAEDRQTLRHPDGVEIQWIIAEREELLARAVALELPSDVELRDLQVFAHGERGVIKALRRHLVAERGIDRAQISISAYWALGRIEDQFQAEKREPIGRIDED